MKHDKVVLFKIPTMKPLDTDKKAEKTVSAPAAAPVQEKIDFSNVKIEPIFKDMVDFDTFSKSDFRAVKVKACEAVKKSKKLLKFVLDDGTGTDRVILSGIHEYYEPEELAGNLHRHHEPPAPAHDGHRVLRYAHFRRAPGKRPGEAPPADGGRPHPRRSQALLMTPEALRQKPEGLL